MPYVADSLAQRAGTTADVVVREKEMYTGQPVVDLIQYPRIKIWLLVGGVTLVEVFCWGCLAFRSSNCGSIEHIDIGLNLLEMLRRERPIAEPYARIIALKELDKYINKSISKSIHK
jgi:hypothetical protein